MSLATPVKIRDLQIKLYQKAKNEPDFRFYQLYDKVYREVSRRYSAPRLHAGEGQEWRAGSGQGKLIGDN